MSLDEENLTPEQGRQHMAEVAQRRSDQLKLLTDAMVYRLEGKFYKARVSGQIKFWAQLFKTLLA